MDVETSSLRVLDPDGRAVPRWEVRLRDETGDGVVLVARYGCPCGGWATIVVRGETADRAPAQLQLRAGFTVSISLHQVADGQATWPEIRTFLERIASGAVTLQPAHGRRHGRAGASVWERRRGTSG